METILTLQGITLNQLAAKLDEELPADAYTQVPGGADLTDIDPNYMRKVLNEVFGICGYGWGYHYESKDLDLQHGIKVTRSGEKDQSYAVLQKMEFWFKLQTGEFIETCTIHASGASENSLPGYALKGAITNAIGNAASNIGFQQSVYLGKRSHHTVGKKPAATTTTVPKPATPAPAAKTTTPAPATAKAPVPAPTAKASAPVPEKTAPLDARKVAAPATAKAAAPVAAHVTDLDLEDLDAPVSPDALPPSSPEDLVIQFAGKHNGKKLSECSETLLDFYANKMGIESIPQDLRAHAAVVKPTAKNWLEYRISQKEGCGA